MIDQTGGICAGTNLGQGVLHIGLCEIAATIQRFKPVGMQDEFAAFGKLVGVCLIGRSVVDSEQWSEAAMVALIRDLGSDQTLW